MMLPKLNKPPELGPYIVRHLIHDDQLAYGQVYTRGEVTEFSGKMTVTKVERQVLTYFDPQYDKMPDAKLFRTAMGELKSRVRGKVFIWKWNFKEMVADFRRRYVKYEPVVSSWLDCHNPF